MGDAHKLEVAQFPENNVQPEKPATFLVRKNGAKGELDAKVAFDIQIYNVSMTLFVFFPYVNEFPCARTR